MESKHNSPKFPVVGYEKALGLIVASALSEFRSRGGKAAVGDRDVEPVDVATWLPAAIAWRSATVMKGYDLAFPKLGYARDAGTGDLRLAKVEPDQYAPLLLLFATAYMSDELALDLRYDFAGLQEEFTSWAVSVTHGVDLTTPLEYSTDAAFFSERRSSVVCTLAAYDRETKHGVFRRSSLSSEELAV